jgi:ribonuclease P protein subunit POP4
MDGSMNGEQTPFVAQLVSHTLHGLPQATIAKVMDHDMTDKFLSLTGAALKRPKKEFEGPKRTKFRKLMSTRQRKANDFDQLSPDCERYELYQPLNDLWKQYMGGLMRKKGDRRQRITKADWHGALIQVVKSCSPGLIGTSGIILQETTNTFKIITKENRYKIVPKAHNIFTIQVSDDQVATIYGNHILYKSADRSVRKYKAKQTLDIGS